MADARRIYRWLLNLQPARFREEYADVLERQFWDEYRDVAGRRGRLLFWLRALSDLAISIPQQIAHEARQDIWHAARVYRQRRLTTALVFAALALAIGAVTGVFSVLNGLLLRSLPFRDAEALVTFDDLPMDFQEGPAAFYDWRNNSAYLQDATAYTTWEMNLNHAAESARARVSEATASFFTTLGVGAIIGRAFSPREDTPGRDDVAVIGYGLWQQIFGGDARAVGATIRLNGAPMTVVGIAPPGFDYPAKTAVWTATRFNTKRLPKIIWLGVGTVGRLKPGLNIAQANATFEAEEQRLNPRRARDERRQRARLHPLREELAGPRARASLVLLGALVFVLLIACANTAHLLLSRTAERSGELRLRAALGASRARLVQQLITESVVLTGTAAAAGLVVAQWVSRLASLARPAQLSALAVPAKLSPTYTLFDWRVLAFTVTVAVLTGVLFGVPPVLLMGRMLQPQDAIRLQPGRQGLGAGRMRSTLVGMQAAFTLVLIAGSLSPGRSFLRLLGADLGFQPERVVTLNVSLYGTRYTSATERQQYYSEVLDRLRGVPGVESAAAIQNLPLVLNTPTMVTRCQLDSGRSVESSLVPASPDYFRAMGTGIIEGREFTAQDRQRSEPVAIVNADFGRESGAKSGMVGRKLPCFAGKRQYTIVGVVRTERFAGPSQPGWSRVFIPLEAQPPPFTTFIARTRGRPEPYLPVCRRAVQQVDPQVPVYDVKTLDERLEDLVAGARFYATVVLFVAVLAILLAILGVYGVAAHSIAQRAHEIGVRIAVGAAPDEVRWMLLARGLVPVAAGTMVGIAGALALGRLLGHLIENTEPTGASICAAAAFGLTATSAAVIWTASRRITQMDPMNALRAE